MVTPSWDDFSSPSSFPKNEINKNDQSDLSQQDQWGNFLSPNTYQGETNKEEEGWIDFLARNLTSNLSRGVEQIGGFYGNLESLGRGLLSKFPAAGGLIGWGISKLVGPEKWQEYVGDKQFLPTSQDFKKLSYELTNDYTKPKTKGEEAINEFTEDVSSLLMARGGGANAFRNPTLRRAYNYVVPPAAANVTKQTLKGLGFSEDDANIAKLATWIPLTLLGNVNAPNYASQLMQNGRNGIPNSVQGNVPRILQNLDRVERNFLTADPRSSLARQQIARIRNDLTNGQTNSRSMFDMYDGINAAKRDAGLFQLNRADRNFARRAIDQVRNVVRDEIRDFGRNYPDALQSWENGVQAWATIHQSRAATNWIEQTAKGPYAKLLAGPAAGLFGIGGYGVSKVAPIVSTSTSAGILAGYKGLQTLYRVWNDPNLRNYYWQAVEAATQENFPVFIKNYERLNKGLESIDSSTQKNNNKNQKN